MNRDSPFRYKQAFILFLILLFAFLVISNVFLVLNLRKDLIVKAEQHLDLSLDIMDAFVREPLLRHDYIGVEQLLMQWAIENVEISGIKAVMPNGFVLVDYVREGESPQKQLTMERKVVFEERELVSLHITKSTQSEGSIVKGAFQLLSGFSVLLTAMLGASLWFAMKRFAMKPLEQEILRRKSTEAKLNSTLDTLEKRVKERTKELQKAYKDILSEIAERKSIEEEIRVSENRFRSLAENSPNMIFINKKGKIIYVNNKCEEMMGYTKEDFYGDNFNFMDLIAPEDKALVKENYQARIGGEDVEPHEYTLLTKDGKRLIGLHNTKLIDYEGEKAILGIITDITTRKNAEDRLRESEEKYRRLTENVTDIIYRFRLYPEPGFDFISNAVIGLTGYSPEDFYSDPQLGLRVIYPDDRKGLESFLQGVLPESPHVARWITRDGSIVWLEDRFTPVYSTDGTLIAVEGVSRDITERVKAEDSLKKASFYLDNASDSIIVINADKKIIKVNKEFSRLWGYSPQDALDADVLKFFPEKVRSKHISEMELAIATKKPRSFETAALTKSGKEIPLSIRGSVFFGKKGGVECFIGSFRDITERKKAETEREALLEEMEQKNRELEQIIYVASHDLRSPLVNIQGFSKELRYALDELEAVIRHKDIPIKIREKLSSIIHEDIHESRQFITGSVAKIDTLISGLLKISRLGQIELHKEEIDMNRLLNDVLISFEYFIKKLGAQVVIYELPLCTADTGQINQVFSNLIDNALKYLDPGRSGIVKIFGHRENGSVVYCVEDNGVGITPEYQKKIFELFQRLEPAEGKGEGLGLSIVKRIIERHHGKLWIESEPGKGSRFFVSLPDFV